MRERAFALVAGQSIPDGRRRVRADPNRQEGARVVLEIDHVLVLVDADGLDDTADHKADITRGSCVSTPARIAASSSRGRADPMSTGMPLRSRSCTPSFPVVM